MNKQSRSIGVDNYKRAQAQIRELTEERDELRQFRDLAERVMCSYCVTAHHTTAEHAAYAETGAIHRDPLTEERDRLKAELHESRELHEGWKSEYERTRELLDRLNEQLRKHSVDLFTRGETFSETLARLLSELTLARAVVEAARSLSGAIGAGWIADMYSIGSALAAYDRHTKASAPPEGSAAGIKREPQPSGAGGFNVKPGRDPTCGSLHIAHDYGDVVNDARVCNRCGARWLQGPEPSGAIAEGASAAREELLELGRLVNNHERGSRLLGNMQAGVMADAIAGVLSDLDNIESERDELREKLRAVSQERDEYRVQKLAEETRNMLTESERDQAVARVGELEKLLERALGAGTFGKGSPTVADIRKALGKAGG